MNCIGPSMPDDAELLAYADNATSSAIQEHVRACPACRKRALELGREERRLQRLLSRAGCPPSLALGEYQLGLVQDPRASELARHIDYCPACRAELADLVAFMDQLRRPAIDAAEAAFGALLTPLRTVIARLSPGPAAGPTGVLVPALRGAQDESEHVPVVYDANDVLITIDSWTERPGQSDRVVAGLVAGPADFTEAEASLDAGQTFNTSPVDDLGNFLFSHVSPGVHHLVIRVPSTGVQIEIGELTVK